MWRVWDYYWKLRLIPNIAGKDGKTLLFWAIDGGYTSITNLLYQYPENQTAAIEYLTGKEGMQDQLDHLVNIQSGLKHDQDKVFEEKRIEDQASAMTTLTQDGKNPSSFFYDKTTQNSDESSDAKLSQMKI